MVRKIWLAGLAFATIYLASVAAPVPRPKNIDGPQIETGKPYWISWGTSEYDRCVFYKDGVYEYWFTTEAYYSEGFQYNRVYYIGRWKWHPKTRLLELTEQSDFYDETIGHISRRFWLQPKSLETRINSQQTSFTSLKLVPMKNPFGCFPKKEK